MLEHHREIVRSELAVAVELVAGSERIEFDDPGEHELKGVLST